MNREPRPVDTRRTLRTERPGWPKALRWVAAIAILAFAGWHFGVGFIRGIAESMP